MILVIFRLSDPLAGVRGFELQTLSDPDGGAYAYSAGLKLAGENSFISPELLEPGVKVISPPINTGKPW